MNIHPGEILLYIVVFLFLLIGLFLLALRQGRPLSNRMLGAFFLAQGLSIVDGYLLIKGVFLEFPSFAFWLNTLPLLFGPLLYGYTLSTIFHDFRLKRRHLWHLLPFLLLSCLFIFTYHLQGTDTKIEFQRRAMNDNSWYVFVGMGFVYGHIFGYLAASLMAVRQYRKTIRNRYSNVNLSNLSWLEFTLLAFGVIIVINLLFNVLRITVLTLNPVILTLFTLSILLFISAVILKALRHSRIFAGIELAETQADGKEKYAYSSLSKQERLDQLQQLLQLMEGKKPYLQPDLSLEELAQMLDIPPKTLSQVINASLDKHFFDFVNHYRIEEAKQLLRDPAYTDHTVLQIMYESGFQSKSSFNTAFKKHTGMTPTQFRKKSQVE